MFSSIERLKFNIFFFNKRLKTTFTNKLQHANEGSNNFTAFNELKCGKKKLKKKVLIIFMNSIKRLSFHRQDDCYNSLDVGQVESFR